MSGRRYWAWGGAILAAALALRILCFVGVRTVEPVLTAWSAHKMVEGRYTAVAMMPGAVNNSRVGLVVPAAAAIKLWGVGHVSCTLWPLACGLGLIATVLALARGLIGDRATLVSASILAVLPADVLYATQLYSDLPMSLLWAASGLVFWRALDRSSVRSAALAGFLAGLSWLMREPGPIFLLVLLAWAIAARAPRLWLPAAAGALPVPVVESIGYLIATGNPFYRVAIMTHGVHNRYMTQEYYTTPGSVLKRVFLDLPSMLLWPGNEAFAFTGGLALAALATIALAGRDARRDPALRRLTIWAGVIFVAFAALPLHVFPFRPAMVLFPRTLIPFSVPLALLVGRGLDDRRWGRGALPAIAAVSLLVLGTRGVRMKAELREAREALAAIADVPAPLILTDDTLSMGGHEANFITFDRGFDPRVDVRSLADADPAALPGAYVLVDTENLQRADRIPPARREQVLNPPSAWRCLVRREQSSRRILLFQIP